MKTYRFTTSLTNMQHLDLSECLSWREDRLIRDGVNITGCRATEAEVEAFLRLHEGLRQHVVLVADGEE